MQTIEVKSTDDKVIISIEKNSVDIDFLTIMHEKMFTQRWGKHKKGVIS